MSDWSANPPRRGQPPQGGGYDYYRGTRRGGPPQAGPPRRPGEQRPQGRPPRQPRPRRRWGRIIGAVVLVLLVLVGVLVFYFDSMLQRTPALAADADKPDTPGTNWLLVGSDSRQGLSEDQRQQLGTGDAAGQRTDSMMLVHVPAGGGQPAMISLPRDSYVSVPGHGKEKINSAYGQGGSQLLAQTVEQNTGVHVDHYAEIGLGGFAGLVDSVGGVNVCLDEPMNDKDAGINLAAGCQDMDGPTALGFVRARHSVKGGDLGRAANQRKVLGALVSQVMSPATLLNPFRMFPLAQASSKTFSVNESDHVWHLASLTSSLGDVSSGQGVTTSAPFGSFGRDSDGQSVIKWDQGDAQRMFGAIAEDQPIPPDLLK